MSASMEGVMRRHHTIPGLAFLLAAATARAAGPTIAFTLPAENATPSIFGSLPYPNDLYFDQGRPADGDGTLLATGASIGLATDVIRTNTGSVEDALDLVDGFGTTTAAFFFLDGPIDVGSLTPSPRLVPTLADPVFCIDATTATPLPIEVIVGMLLRPPVSGVEAETWFG